MQTSQAFMLHIDERRAGKLPKSSDVRKNTASLWYKAAAVVKYVLVIGEAGEPL